MRRGLLIAALFAAGCNVEGDISVGPCPGTSKVAGVDPESAEVFCEADRDTRYETGAGLGLEPGNALSIDPAAVADSRRLPAGYRYGLEVEYAGESSVRVRPGRCRDQANAANIVLAESSIADIEDRASSGALEEEPNAWYFVWVIADTSGAQPTRAYLSPQRLDPPTAEGRYDAARLLGAVRNQGGGFVPFRQAGRIDPYVFQTGLVVRDAGAGEIPADTPVRVPVADAVPPGTERATVSASADGEARIEFFDVDPDGPVAEMGDSSGLRATQEVPISAGEIELRATTSDGGVPALRLAVTGYAWGPQEGR